MVTDYPPTLDEMRAAYRRAGIWRLGWSFVDALAVPMLRWAMEKSALAARRRDRLPVQPALF